MDKIRIRYFLSGVLFFIVTNISDTYYRTWAYHNKIYDFGLANYLPSITGTITAICIIVSITTESIRKSHISSLWVSIGCIIYEIMQPTFGTGIFDWQDFFAVLATGCVTYFILYKLNKSSLKPTAQ